MNKKYLSLFLLLLAVLAWGENAPAAQTRAPEKAFRLAFLGSYPDSHPVVNEVFTPWAVSIAEKTNNRLIITYYGPDIFLPEENHFEAMRRGVAPIAQQATAMTSGRLYVSSFLNVPGGMSSSVAASSAYWRMFRNTPEMRKEYEDYKLITLHASPPVELHLSFSLKDASSLKGKRILCQDSFVAAMLRGAGASPLILPESEYYQTLARGQAEGVALPFDMLIAYNLDSFPFLQSVCLNLNTAPYWTIMNKAAFDALPRDLQRVLEGSIGEKLGLQTAAILDMAYAAGKARLAGKGVQIRELNRSEREKWRELFTPPARDLWLSYMKQERVQEPEKILDRAQRFYRESESAHGR